MKIRFKLLRAGLLAAVLCAVLSLPAVHAAIIHVTPEGTGDGSSWASPQNLRGALASAVTGDELWLKEGVYFPDEGTGATPDDPSMSFGIGSGISVYGGFAGTETARNRRSPEDHVTILSGDLDQTDQHSNIRIVVDIQDPNDPDDDISTTYYDDVPDIITDPTTIHGSNAVCVVRIHNVADPVVVDGVTITAGNASFSGGALDGANSEIVINDCRFVGNRSQVRGGAVSLQDCRYTVSNCRFELNQSAVSGGAMVIVQTAVELRVFDGDLDSTITTSRFSGNWIEPNAANPEEFAASGIGGALAFVRVGDEIVPGTSRSYYPRVISCIFSGNVSHQEGGAVGSNGVPVSFINCNMVGNRSAAPAGTGGSAAVFRDANSELVNCILWGNTDENGDDDAVLTKYGFSPSYYHCLIEGASDVTLNTRGGGNFDGTNAANAPDFLDVTIDAAAAPTTDFGLFQLPYDSPLVDAGYALAAWQQSSTDFYGADRVTGTAPDVGASETSPGLYPEATPDRIAFREGRNEEHEDALDLSAAFGGRIASEDVLSMTLISNDNPAVVTSVSLGTAQRLVTGQDPVTYNTGYLDISLGPDYGVSQVVLYLHTTLGTALYTVNVHSGSANIYVNPLATGTGTGESWANAFTDLGDALDATAAGNSFQHQIVWVAEGTYYRREWETFALREGVYLVGGFDSSGTATQLSESNPAANPTILSGDAALGSRPTLGDTYDARHIVTAEGGVTSNTVLRGFTIIGAGAWDGEKGGGLYLPTAGDSPVIQECIFEYNRSHAVGAAVYCAVGSEARFVDCVFRYNIGTGPGIYADANSAITVENSHFLANNGSGALWLAENTNATLLNVEFRENQGADAGAVYNGTNGTSTFTQVLFTGNRSFNNAGAFANHGAPTLINCSFSGNRGGDSGTAPGGAFGNGAAALPVFKNTIIWNNSYVDATNVQASSIGNLAGTFSHCLIENCSESDLGGTGNLDGTNAANDPDFLSEPDPATAPTSSGNLRLGGFSMAIDAGLNASNPESLDLDGEARMVGTAIDMGAYESSTGAAVTTLSDSGNGSLRAAVAAVPDGGVIVLRPDLNGGSVPFASPISIEKDLTIDASHLPAGLTLSGGHATRLFAIAEGVTVSFANLVFADGLATAADGGAVQAGATTNLSFEDCEFSGNAATGGGDGGALYQAGGTLTIERCLFHNNQSDGAGGALSLQDTSGTIRNSAMAGNRGSGGGGAIVIDGGGNLVMTNGTVQGNHGDLGGGGILLSSGSTGNLTVRNTLIWDNAGQLDSISDESYRLDAASTATVSFANSLVEHVDLSASGGNLDGTLSPASMFAAPGDPSLAPAVVGNLQLMGSSPAVDAGENSYLSSINSATDLSGNPRLQGAAVDLGAYEGGQVAANGERLLVVDGGTAVGFVDLAAVLGLQDVVAAELLSNDSPGLISAVVGSDGMVDLNYAVPTVDGDINLVFYAATDASSGIYNLLLHLRQDSVLRVKLGATGTADGYTWPNAYPNLQDALTDVVAGQEVWVAAGTYLPDVSSLGNSNDRAATFTLKDGVALFGGFAGTEALRSERRISENTSILSGDVDQNDLTLTPSGENAYHVVSFAGEVTDSTTLDGFTIVSGLANGSSPNNSGPAILLSGGVLTLTSCVISDHQADQFGAVYVHGDGTLQADSCVLTRNHSGYRGGAIRIFRSTDDSQLSNLSLSGNSSAIGGALAVDGVELAIHNTLIWDNLATGGTNAEGSMELYNATATFSHNLIEHWDLSASGNNLDGTDSANDPLFYSSTDLRLMLGSPAIDTGDSALASSLDVQGNDRIHGAAIDIGGHEMHYTTSSKLTSIAKVDMSQTGVFDLSAIFNAGTTGFALYSNTAAAFLTVTVKPDGAVDFSSTSDSLIGDYALVFSAIDGGNQVFHQVDLSVVPEIIFVDAGATAGGNDGTSWANAYVTLQDALANFAAGEHEAIWVAAGTYLPSATADRSESFLVPSGVVLYGGFTGTESLLEERDVSANPTILSGDLNQDDLSVPGLDNARTIMQIADGAQSVVIDGFTLTNANANGGGTGKESRGGALYANNASFTVRNCQFLNSYAISGGAGLYLADSTLEIMDSVFDQNLSNGGGGALAYQNSSLTLSGCTFTSHQVTGDGGVLNSSPESIVSTASTLDVLNCRFAGNSAAYGGAVASGPGDVLSFTNCLFSGNTSSGGSGTVFGLEAAQSLTLINCTLADNGGSGSLIHTQAEPAASSLTLLNTIIWGNAVNTVANTITANITVTYNHSLVEGVDLTATGTGNLDGSDAANAPLFLATVDPATAPHVGGDYQIPNSSPLISQGEVSYNSSVTDLAGRDRVIGTLDLGAYEATLAHYFVKANVTGGTQDGFSWENAFPTLQDALLRAVDGDVIWVARGTYYPDETMDSDSGDRNATFNLVNGVSVYGGFEGNETSLEQRNGNPAITILNGDIDKNGNRDSGNAYTVVTATNVEAPTVFDGFTISNGNANAGSGFQTNGNSHYQQAGNASGNGGGLHISGGSPIIRNCNVINCYATGGGGGIMAINTSLELSDCYINNNRVNNEKGAGAGLLIRGTGESEIRRTIFRANQALNDTMSWGGGAYVGAKVTFTDCLFRGNRAHRGGGISTFGSEVSTLINCLVSGNYASNEGGGIYHRASPRNTAINCTIVNNYAQGAGGGMKDYTGGNHEWINCLVWNNGPNDANAAGESSKINFTSCLVEGLVLTGDAGFDGTLAGNEPNFINMLDLRSFPRTGGDYHLQAGSFGLDAGLDSANTSSTDLDGAVRISGSAIDLGAYERDGNPPVLTLLGSVSVVHPAGTPYVDAGATASDDVDGDLTGSIVVGGAVDVNTQGTYLLTYDVSDSAGNAATQLTRSVYVDVNEVPYFASSTLALSVDERSAGSIYRAEADDPDGGVRFTHPGYVALFPTDEGTGPGASDLLGSGLAFSFSADRWTVDTNAPGGDYAVAMTAVGDGSVMTVDSFAVSNGLTVASWLRLDDLSVAANDPVIWKFGDISLSAVDGDLVLTGPSGSLSATIPFAAGDWVYLTLSIDPSGDATLFLDGAEILNGQIGFDPILTDNSFGHDVNDSTSGVSGAISDLSLIDGTLTATQLELLYQSALNAHLGDVLNYSLGASNDEAHFTIDAYTGELSLATALQHEFPLDADANNAYVVEIIVTDSAGLSAIQLVEVTIVDTNIAPVITGTLVDPILEETGFNVYEFTVVDADTPQYDHTVEVTDSRFAVSLVGGGVYRVHRLSGHRFDYESNPDYDFDLIVSDGLEEDRVNIAFTLTNTNDNAPVVTFTSAGPVTENDPGAVLGTIEVTDADGPTTFYYDLPPSFEVTADGTTVKLKDGVSLDYEDKSSFNLPIVVYDLPLGNSTGNYGFTIPTISVLNVNDVAPSNIQLLGNQVTENAAGAVVGTLSASDADGPTLTFSVSDPRFEVDGTSLKLIDGLALDRESTPSVPLTVTASDGTFEASEDFTITVLNIDEGGPANLALSNASIPENSTGVVGTLSATDVDGDAITFSQSDPRFTISGTTLSLTTAVNHESLADGTIALDITATAAGVATTETFVITIEDVNETPILKLTIGNSSGLTGSFGGLPVLENVRQATVAESGEPGATRYPISFQPTDVDDDPLTYLLGGADAAAFTVDPASGALNFVTPADFEAPGDANGDGTYQVTVAVSDGALTSNTITLGLVILNTADEPYDHWIDSFFPGETDPAIIGPDAINASGLTNALCFAFNQSPLDTSPVPLVPVVIDSATMAFDFEYRRDGVIFNPIIAYSTNLQGFTEVAVPAVTTTVAPGLEIIVITDGVDPGIDQVSLRVDKTLVPRIFARLGVTP